MAQYAGTQLFVNACTLLLRLVALQFLFLGATKTYATEPICRLEFSEDTQAGYMHVKDGVARIQYDLLFCDRICYRLRTQNDDNILEALHTASQLSNSVVVSIAVSASDNISLSELEKVIKRMQSNIAKVNMHRKEYSINIRIVKRNDTEVPSSSQ